MSSESDIRKNKIDLMLIESGWPPLVSYSEGKSMTSCTIEEYPTKTGPADYVLVHNGKILAVVEAKKEQIGPQENLRQSERYAEDLDANFVYATNGEQIVFRDLSTSKNVQRELKSHLFHNPQYLEDSLTNDFSYSEYWLKSNSIPEQQMRPCGKSAVESTEINILGGKRQMLIAMATGSGKTRVAISLISRLIRSKRVKKVLFLVDRRSLAFQALQRMNEFTTVADLKFSEEYQVYCQKIHSNEDTENIHFDTLDWQKIESPNFDDTFVVISTVQGIASKMGITFNQADYNESEEIEEDDDDLQEIRASISAFDLIIVDECHRGYTKIGESKWRQVLDHFDAIKVGLTATPAKHSMAYFRDIVYRYSLEEAIADGILVPPRLIKIDSEIYQQGTILKKGDFDEVIDAYNGQKNLEELDDSIDLPAKNIDELTYSIEDSNKKIIKEFARYVRDFEIQTGRFPKTLVFAEHDIPHKSHADRLVSYLRDEFSEKGNDFVKKITSKVDDSQGILRQFRTDDSLGIAVTVDMLTTGVDIRPLECLIFLRLTSSRILIEQMIGRGTRTCEELEPPKDHFKIFDAVGLYDLFLKKSEIVEYIRWEKGITVKSIVKAIKSSNDEEQKNFFIKKLKRKLIRINKQMHVDEVEKFQTLGIPDGDLKSFAENLDESLTDKSETTIKILSNPSLLDLFENYKRQKDSLRVALNQEDTITSSELISVKNGTLPFGDYISEFERYVKHNPDEIASLDILLNKPENFTYDDFKSLRNDLRKSDLIISESSLKTAYKNPLSDFVGFILHATKNKPLISKSERIDLAISDIKNSLDLNDKQLDWLDLISSRLKGLDVPIILKDDLNAVQFQIKGMNLNRARQTFDDIDQFLTQINQRLLQ